jgi:transposase
MNSATISGASSSRCSRTNHASFSAWITNAFSMASFGSCDQVRRRRDLPKNYGPPTTCYNRFVRWRRASIWTRSWKHWCKQLSPGFGFKVRHPIFCWEARVMQNADRGAIARLPRSIVGTAASAQLITLVTRRNRATLIQARQYRQSYSTMARPISTQTRKHLEFTMPMLTEQSVPAIAAMLGVAGPVLTVKSVRDGWVICTWWNGDYGEFQSGLSDRTSDDTLPL